MKKFALDQLKIKLAYYKMINLKPNFSLSKGKPELIDTECQTFIRERR